MGDPGHISIDDFTLQMSYPVSFESPNMKVAHHPVSPLFQIL